MWLTKALFRQQNTFYILIVLIKTFWAFLTHNKSTFTAIISKQETQKNKKICSTQIFQDNLNNWNVLTNIWTYFDSVCRVDQASTDVCFLQFHNLELLIPDSWNWVKIAFGLMSSKDKIHTQQILTKSVSEDFYRNEHNIWVTW